ncbi:MAG: CPBP family intramembrane metalloprotease [Oscillospiraceae bacterium]|jgi:membrane protease YdiL (CAAX protease family)|nr:CPBP family intramembrane metalloprotease [Oscillospiraceae bacterium]
MAKQSASKSPLRVVVFTALSIILTWVPLSLIILGVWTPASTTITLLFSICMLVPAFSVVVTRLVTREGFKNFMLRPNFKGHALTYLAAWFLPPLLIALGAALYFVIYPANFDLSMSTAAEQIKAQLEAAGAGGLVTDSYIKMILLLQLVIGVALAPILNIFFCLGEELGWRGYLLPKLDECMSVPIAVLVNGIIWGVWHAPMIILGHNYGTQYSGYPYIGIVGMILFCVFVGALFSYLTYKAKSAIPAAIAHGALNGMAAAGVIFNRGNVRIFQGPLPVGYLGGAAFIVAGAVCFLLFIRLGRKNKLEQAAASAETTAVEETIVVEAPAVEDAPTAPPTAETAEETAAEETATEPTSPAAEQEQ